MKLLLVDDEALALDRLERILNAKKAGKLFRAQSQEEAIKLFKDHIKGTPFNLVFLDIEMPGQNGIELAHTFLEWVPTTHIVFQTAYDHYLQDAFAVGSLDYLLKPIDEEKIERVLERFNRLYKAPKMNELIFNARLGDDIHLIRPGELFYVKADLDEVVLRTAEKSLYLSRKISEMEELLVSQGFFRIHRSVLVNLHKVKKLTSLSQSRYEIFFHNLAESVQTSKEGARLLRLHLERLGS